MRKKGDFMKTTYVANPSYNLSNPILNTQTKFWLNDKGRLCKILWRYEVAFGGTQESVWGDEKRVVWNLEEVNENDLIRAFTELALGNPDDFKELYYALKEHDEVVFPCIEETLKQVRELFDFN